MSRQRQKHVEPLLSHGAVCAALGLGPEFAKGPGSLKSHYLCCSWERLTLPCTRLLLSSCCPLESPKPAQPGQPFLCPESGAVPHTALHILSQVGQGVDSAPPRHRHTLHRSFCVAGLQGGLFLLCVCPRAGEPLRGCWVWGGEAVPQPGEPDTLGSVLSLC